MVYLSGVPFHPGSRGCGPLGESYQQPEMPLVSCLVHISQLLPKSSQHKVLLLCLGVSRADLGLPGLSQSSALLPYPTSAAAPGGLSTRGTADAQWGLPPFQCQSHSVLCTEAGRAPSPVLHRVGTVLSPVRCRVPLSDQSLDLELPGACA